MKHPLLQISILVSLCGALPSSVSAESRERYLCVVDTSVGLDYNKATKKWGPAIFSAGDKYILRYLDRAEADVPSDARGKWGLFHFGTSWPLTWCGDDAWNKGFFYCDSFDIFSFQKDTLRFQHIYRYGYVHGSGINDDDGANDNPAISVGTCSPF